MAEEQHEPEQPAAPPRRISTPIMVGSMAAMIMAVVFLVAIIRGGPEEPAPLRSGRDAAPLAASRPPSGEASEDGLTAGWPRGPVPREGIAFRWEPVAGIQEYQVTVYDTLMKRIWLSPRLREVSVEPPEKIRNFMRNGTPYHWKVVGFTDTGRTVESRSVTFRLVE